MRGEQAGERACLRHETLMDELPKDAWDRTIFIANRQKRRNGYDLFPQGTTDTRHGDEKGKEADIQADRVIRRLAA